MIELKNYINGALVTSCQDQYIDVIDPSTGDVFAKAPKSNELDVQLAYEAAKFAFPAWSALSIEERATYLESIAEKILEQLDSLAKAESKDNGKPVFLAKHVDIPRAAKNFKFYAQAITQFHSETYDMGSEGFNYTLRQPLGVVGCISPWNLPLYLFSWKIAPALAAGNTVVAKPSEVTPYTAYLLSKICIEVGLPDGVLNIVHGEGEDVGSPITEHPGIKAISFTGSTRVGGIIAAKAATMFKKVSLEMGGKNANIIFDDCNYEKMLKTTVHSSFSNQGQICLCGSRIYVHENIYDRFLNDFIERTEQLVVGHPAKKETRVGAIVSKPHYEKILNHIDWAKDAGGQIVSGGHAVYPQGYEHGYYIQPTIITGLDNSCKTNQEEIFGPVVTIQKFSTYEEVVALANDNDYGLSCTIWTNNLSRAHRLAKDMHVGIVWVNTWLKRDLRTPFGGAKNSGVGREGGFDALHFFTEPKNVCIEY